MWWSDLTWSKWKCKWSPGENIFIVKNGQLITPSLSSSALEGITRDAILKIGKDLDIDVIERDFKRSELVMAEEIFLTGTAAEITPIKSIDDINFSTGENTTSYKLMNDFTDLVNSSI